MLASDTIAGRVLVVEDDAEIADVLRRTLRQEGHEVRSAADGVAALEAAEDFVPDLVILDLGLPKVDGLTLLRAWRAAGNATPVLVLTARGTWHEKVHGIDSGADDYVAKPFRMEEVVARRYTHLITDVFEDDPHSPLKFHLRVLGFERIATHRFGELSCASPRVVLVLDLKRAYQRLKARRDRVFRTLTSGLTDALEGPSPAQA